MTVNLSIPKITGDIPKKPRDSKVVPKKLRDSKIVPKKQSGSKIAPNKPRDSKVAPKKPRDSKIDLSDSSVDPKDLKVNLKDQKYPMHSSNNIDESVLADLHKAYKGKSVKTIQNYLHRLEHLRSDENLFPGKDILWIVSDPPASYDVIRAKYPNINSRKNILTIILVLFRNSPSLRDALAERFDKVHEQWRTYHDHMNAFQEAAYRKNVPDTRHLQKYVGFEEMTLKYKELKKGTGHDTFQNSLDIVLLSLVLHTPPKRADFGSLRVYYEDDPNTKDTNYIVLRTKTPSFITMNTYKTSALYARVDTDIPFPTIVDIKDSLRRWPRDYLFESRSKKPFASNNAYSKWVTSRFVHMFGRSTGVTMLRHIYITEKVDLNNMNDDELEDIAHQMLHSVRLQRKYNWKKDAVCKSIKLLCADAKSAK